MNRLNQLYEPDMTFTGEVKLVYFNSVSVHVFLKLKM